MLETRLKVLANGIPLLVSLADKWHSYCKTLFLKHPISSFQIRGKSCFFSQAEVPVIHAAVNLDAKMHEAEDVCKYFLRLYAFIFKRTRLYACEGSQSGRMTGLL